MTEPSPHLNNPADEAREESQRLARLMHARRVFWLGVIIFGVVVLFAGWQHAANWLNLDQHITSANVIIGVDPNIASWADLALLPGLGESVAKRIVAYRTDRRTQLGPDVLVFEKPADLLPVNGIGHRMLLKIKGALRFPKVPATQFDSPTDGD